MASAPVSRCLYTRCPLCESTDFRSLLSADCRAHALYHPGLPPVIHWQQCQACSHCFANGYFSHEAMRTLFAAAHDYQLFDPETMERCRAVAARMIDNVCSVLTVPQGRWLDVGFGNGSLLTTCAEYGFDPIGVDLREDAVQRMRGFGYEVHCLEFTEYTNCGALTVISMADVLEHMPFPRMALSHANRLLTDGGVLLVSCPNMDSPLWRVLTERNSNPYWIESEHYHNFGRRRLYEVLREHGFEPVRYSVSERYRIGMEVSAVKQVRKTWGSGLDL